MQDEVLRAFFEESETTLTALRGGLLVFARGAREPKALESPIAIVRSLRSTASMFDLHELNETLAKLDEELGHAAALGPEISEIQVTSLLDSLVAAERILGNLHINAAGVGLDVSDFVDRSFDLLFADRKAHDREKDILQHDAFSQEEIDPELREVFAAEAEELLTAIESRLATLVELPNSNEALWEIKRHAHTFKGAAGIVGLETASRLAHKMEDVLETLSTSSSDDRKELAVLLQEATRVLRSLASDDHDRNAERDAARIAEALGEIRKSPGAAIVKNVPLPSATTNETLGEHFSQKATRRSIVRVPLEKLDALLANVRTLLSGRTAIETCLNDYERELLELGAATERLRDAGLRVRNGDAVEKAAGHSALNGRPETALPPALNEVVTKLQEVTADAGHVAGSLDEVRTVLKELYDDERDLVALLQDGLIDVRMVAFSSLENRLKRAISVTCEDENKLAELVLENAGVLVDTQVAESLVEPLVHLMKNAVVHGIERPEMRRLLGKREVGTVKISLADLETHIELAVSDDGTGINMDALKRKAVEMEMLEPEEAAALSGQGLLDLIFLRGLTTAEKLNLSAGRGVGMGIVRESIESAGGSMSISSALQVGTTFTIRMPLPFAVAKVTVIRLDERPYVVPSRCIVGSGTLPRSAIRAFGTDQFVELADRTIRFCELRDLIGESTAPPLSNDIVYLTIGEAENAVVVAVDEIIGSQETIIRPSRQTVRGVFGETILSDGQSASALDVPSLLGKPAGRPKTENGSPSISPRPRLLLVDDSPSVRHSTFKIAEEAGYAVTTASNGVEALQKLGSLVELPDVILSDLDMPEMGGLELARRIRSEERLKELPIVFMTSRSGENDRSAANAVGVEDYLIKPCEPERLIASVNAIVARTRGSAIEL